MNVSVLLTPFPGYSTLRQCDWVIRRAALTPEEMTEFLRQEMDEPEVVAVNVDCAVSAWGELFEEMAGRWS